MGSGSRVLLSLYSSAPFLSLSSAQLRFKPSLAARVSSHMAHAASSVSTDNPSASSAIDFLSLCHRLKVLIILSISTLLISNFLLSNLVWMWNETDNKTSRMVAKRHTGAWIYSGSYVSHGFDGSHRTGFSWHWQR